LFQKILLGFTQIAGQSLYLDDLFSFFEIQPTILSPFESKAVSAPDPAGHRLRQRRVPLSAMPKTGRFAG
jgi:ATP-binding cassette subfamily B protein